MNYLSHRDPHTSYTPEGCAARQPHANYTPEGCAAYQWKHYQYFRNNKSVGDQ